MARIIKSESVKDSQAPAQAVLSLEGFACEARQVVLDARKEAVRITAEARGQVDAAARAAAEKGYAEGLTRGQADGFEAGRKAGLAEARQEVLARSAGLVELAEKTVAELGRAKGELLHEGRCQVLDFALELAAKIVGRVAAEGGTAARENLRKALELAEPSAAVCVKVNPAQLADLTVCLPELVEALGRSGDVRLVGDAAISPGGVKVHTDCGEIDATIETQWANVVEALLGSAAGMKRPVGTAGDGDWLRSGTLSAASVPVPASDGSPGQYVSCADQPTTDTCLGNGDRHPPRREPVPAPQVSK
jgi:flagellar biosynthesis/type III secretory pathway protein FliH